MRGRRRAGPVQLRLASEGPLCIEHNDYVYAHIGMFTGLSFSHAEAKNVTWSLILIVYVSQDSRAMQVTENVRSLVFHIFSFTCFQGCVSSFAPRLCYVHLAFFTFK